MKRKFIRFSSVFLEDFEICPSKRCIESLIRNNGKKGMVFTPRFPNDVKVISIFHDFIHEFHNVVIESEEYPDVFILEELKVVCEKVSNSREKVQFD